MPISKTDLVEYISKEEISRLTRHLAKQIEADYKNKDLIVVCPLKGSIHFAADLIREINLPLEVDFVLLSSSGRGGAPIITHDINTNIRGKHVLILEEIIDSGRKLTFLRNRLLLSGPQTLKIVTLLDKPARRELPIAPDYVGRTIDDRFVIGYGMDADGYGRNFPEIYLSKN